MRAMCVDISSTKSFVHSENWMRVDFSKLHSTTPLASAAHTHTHRRLYVEDGESYRTLSANCVENLMYTKHMNDSLERFGHGDERRKSLISTLSFGFTILPSAVSLDSFCLQFRFCKRNVIQEKLLSMDRTRCCLFHEN